jgi:tRNA A37 threonylcarbamoyladenosine synthetase subunit TsaC/SUA5/YrdC/protein-tyrosine-phosphatase
MTATLFGPDEWPEAAEWLRQGRVVAFPTDTVYGLGAVAAQDLAARGSAASSPDSEALRRAKPGRSAPFSLHCGSVETAIREHGALSGGDEHALRALAPHGVTVVARWHDGSVGVRVVEHELGARMLEAVDMPVLATSANEPGKPPLRDPTEIAKLPGVDAVLDAGVLPERPPSTVVKLLPCGVQVLREGAMNSGEVGLRLERHVHFVCLGNLNRSAFAHHLLHEAQEWLKLHVPGLIPAWRVTSSGLVARGDTRPPPHMIRAAAAYGVELTEHVPVRWAGSDAELVIAMGDDVYSGVRKERDDALNWRVEDPMGKEPAAYERSAAYTTQRLRYLLAQWAITGPQDAAGDAEFRLRFLTPANTGGILS